MVLRNFSKLSSVHLVCYAACRVLDSIHLPCGKDGIAVLAARPS